MPRFLPAFAASLLTAPVLIGVAEAKPPQSVPGLKKINHIIVIYLENRSFDNLYGIFPGANGVANASEESKVQVDKSGKPYDKLPPVLNLNVRDASGKVANATDARFPSDLPNTGPFRAENYAGVNQTTGDAWHRFYQEQYQINDGKMNKFVSWSDAGSLVMHYYDGSKIPLWDYAKKYTLADNFFHAAFGGSFINHFWLVCACTPVYKDAPADIVASVDANGAMTKDNNVTPDGYAVNTMRAVTGPKLASDTDPAKLLPLQTLPNIGDRLSAKHVDWAWYSGGWNDALAGKPDPDFQNHHQVFAMFKNTAIGTAEGKKHVRDAEDLFAGIQRGKLPNVVFYKPVGEYNEHPGYANVSAGERHTADVIKSIENSKLWKDSLIVVTYDENGGLWDHVAPPKIDKWGPGTRVPTLIISPFAKKGFVDHTMYDTTSILKLIETRYGLEPLGTRDADANDLTNALDLGAK